MKIFMSYKTKEIIVSVCIYEGFYELRNKRNDRMCVYIDEGYREL